MAQLDTIAEELATTLAAAHGAFCARNLGCGAEDGRMALHLLAERADFAAATVGRDPIPPGPLSLPATEENLEIMARLSRVMETEALNAARRIPGATETHVGLACIEILRRLGAAKLLAMFGNTLLNTGAALFDQETETQEVGTEDEDA